jgi:hypothetical protein
MIILCLFFFLFNILDTEYAYSVPILAFNIIFWTQNMLILCLFWLFIQYFRHRICFFSAYFGFLYYILISEYVFLDHKDTLLDIADTE